MLCNAFYRAKWYPSTPPLFSAKANIQPASSFSFIAALGLIFLGSSAISGQRRPGAAEHHKRRPVLLLPTAMPPLRTCGHQIGIADVLDSITTEWLWSAVWHERPILLLFTAQASHGGTRALPAFSAAILASSTALPHHFLAL